MEKETEDKDYELECLVRAIKEVEMAKANKPEKYKKALSMLKAEVGVISSIADLRKVKAAKANEMIDKEDEDGSEEE